MKTTTTLDNALVPDTDFPNLVRSEKAYCCAEGDFTYVRHKREKNKTIIYCGMNNYMCIYAGDNVGGLMLCNAVKQSEMLCKAI